VQSASRAGRPQRPVDPGAGPGQQLALALRRLREDSGNPTYRAMAERAHYSASALARAASGAAFPSRDLVRAYVRSCGGDQAEWDQRWAAAAARAGHDDEPGHAPRQGPQGREPHEGKPRRRPRRLAIAAAAAVVVSALTAGILLLTGQRHPVPRPPASVASTSAAAGNSQPAGPEAAVPERRNGLLVLAPGQVADLDTPASRAPAWGIVNEPGSASDDIWFSITDYGLHGNQNANIAVLPAGSAASHSACALEQDYGVTLDAPRIRPGQLVCDITSDNRVALLRITDVRHAANGTPDQVTFDVTVWVPPHKT
jgi:Helix-turn-helix domain